MLHVQVLHIQNGFLPPIYSNEWRDNGGSMTVNRFRPRPNLSVLTATRKRIKIFFTLLSLFGFSYLTFSFENVYLWWVQFSPIIHIKTPKNVSRGEGMFHIIVFKSRCFTRSHKKRRVSKTILFFSLDNKQKRTKMYRPPILGPVHTYPDKFENG